jgi:hypothetical protein
MFGAKSLEGFEPAEARHRDVQHNDFGLVLLDLIEHLAAVAGLTADLQVLLRLEKPSETLADNSVVVCYED